MTVPTCWACGKKTDDATSVARDGAGPSAGDVSVCFYCAAIAIFTGDSYHTRPPTDEERAALLADPRVSRTAGSILIYQALDS